MSERANWNVIGMTNLGGSLVERHKYSPYGRMTVDQFTGFGDWDGDGDADSGASSDRAAGESGTPDGPCRGSNPTGACRILDLDFDNDVLDDDLTLFDLLPQGLLTYSGRTATNVDQPFGHQGLLYEPEIGSYQNRARQYNPSARRFIQRDPAKYIDGLNLYNYVRANPKNYLDPIGRDSCLCCAFGDITMTINAVGVPCAGASYLDALGAAEAAIGAFPGPSCHNNQCDGFRHCYWSCLITINPDCGKERAKLVTSAHEACETGQPAGEEAMDEHNNELGRIFGSKPNPSDCNCNSDCYNAAVNAGVGNSGGSNILQTKPGGEPPQSPFPHCRD